MLDALIKRLQQTTAFDAAFQLALAQSQLGRIYERCRSCRAGDPDSETRRWAPGSGS